METELKMLVAREDQARIARLPLVREHTRGRAVRRRLVNVYYDTPARDCLERALMVRLRRCAGTWILCVKGRGDRKGGLHRRLEFEAEVPGPELDFSRLPDDPVLRPLRKGKLAERLEPVFETTFWRTSRELELPEGARVECCVDQGTIQAGGRVEPISEVELELMRGEPAVLYELAAAMGAAFRLHPFNVSKAERGYRLLDSDALQPVRAVTLGLSAATTVEQALETILWNGLEQMQANEEPLLRNRDAEALHQFRIGQRRMRTALRLFRPVLPGPATAPVRATLRELGIASGPPRDADVLLLQHLEPMLAACPGHAPLAEGVRRARQQRERDYEALLLTLQSQAYSQHLLDLSAWIATRAWRKTMTPAEGASLEQPVIALATPLLERRHRRLLKRGRKLDRLGEDALHALRIEIKRQRYTVEFFQALYKKKMARAYRDRLRDLQDQLGRLNDHSMVNNLLKNLYGEEPDPGLQPAVCFVAGWCTKDRARARRRLAESWAAFAGQKTFW